MFKINGVDIKTPRKFDVGYQDIDADSSGRNAAGDMVRDRLTRKVKIDIEWGPMSDFEISYILSRILGTFFSVTYHDPLENRVLEKTFYAGDRTMGTYSWSENTKI